MSDLIERLEYVRDNIEWTVGEGSIQMAIDEIERLREGNHNLRLRNIQFKNDLRKAEAEIERLNLVIKLLRRQLTAAYAWMYNSDYPAQLKADEIRSMK